jgi:hypothetical protein
MIVHGCIEIHPKDCEGWIIVTGFRVLLITLWPHYLEHVTSERFTRRSQSGAGNQNRPIHGGVTTHTGGSVSFTAHAKRMVRLI